MHLHQSSLPELPVGNNQLKKAVYGLKDSPRLFILWMEKVMKSLKFNIIGPGVFKRENTCICIYVDGMVISTDNIEQVMKDIKKVIDVDDAMELKHGEKNFIVGYDLEKLGDDLSISLDYFR